MLSEMGKEEKMNKIGRELLTFKRSPLYKYRIENNFLPVIGQGSHDAKIFFIGEAPGKKEAMTGRPFCGVSGKILDELLAHIKINREEVYITNVVKDRPENNRDPKSNEIELYAPFLDKQLEIIQPKIIATLGRFSMEYIMTKFGLEKKIKIISQIHGQKFIAKTSWGKVIIIPFYHPAVAVYNRNQLYLLKKDFEILI